MGTRPIWALVPPGREPFTLSQSARSTAQSPITHRAQFCHGVVAASGPQMLIKLTLPQRNILKLKIVTRATIPLRWDVWVTVKRWSPRHQWIQVAPFTHLALLHGLPHALNKHPKQRIIRVPQFRNVQVIRRLRISCAVALQILVLGLQAAVAATLLLMRVLGIILTMR